MPVVVHKLYVVKEVKDVVKEVSDRLRTQKTNGDRCEREV